MTTNAVRFCGACGGLLAPSGQDSTSVTRLACPVCARVTYRNPAVGVAVVILEGETILLGRRARGVWARRWCIPCGYVEWDEEIRAAARREMREETGLDVEIGAVCAVHSNFHDPERQTVGVWFHGRVRSGELRAGDDLDRLGYFPLAQPPELAFPTDGVVIAALRDTNR